MGHKIFVSYKYGDYDVGDLPGIRVSTTRDYVDIVEAKVDRADQIYKGESDGESLASLSDDAIWERLKQRIYDSTLTIVMVSRGMRNPLMADKDQWIPHEISYSLKEISRVNESGNPVTSRTNAMLAVAVPDSTGSYDHFLEDKTCCATGCRMIYRNDLFAILRKNMFNIKSPDTSTCKMNDMVYHGDSSYILSVKWTDFVSNMSLYIDKAYAIQEKIDEYEITKEP